MSPPAPVPGLFSTTVAAEWIGRSGFMQAAYYVHCFDRLVAEWQEYLGLGRRYREATGQIIMAAECHIHYRHMLRAGESLRFTAMLLDYDEKRFHYYLEMHYGNEGVLAASFEQLALHIDSLSRRVTPMHAEILARLGEVKRSHDRLPRPVGLGSVMRLRPHPQR